MACLLIREKKHLWVGLPELGAFFLEGFTAKHVCMGRILSSSDPWSLLSTSVQQPFYSSPEMDSTLSLCHNNLSLALAMWLTLVFYFFKRKKQSQGEKYLSQSQKLFSGWKCFGRI